MGRATFVTVADLRSVQAAEIEAGLRGDVDAAGRHFDSGEALARVAAAQSPVDPEQAIEQLRLAQWLLGFGEGDELRVALAEALAFAESKGLSGQALNLVRRATRLPCDDPLARKALRSFWVGARVQGVEQETDEAVSPPSFV